jgi:hypothetical protein
MVYYSKSNNQFYDTIFYSEDQIPEDKVEITDEEYLFLLTEVSSNKGLLITPNELGYPILVDRPKPTYEELSEFARKKRNQLLLESDWTDTVSAKERLGSLYYDWQNYRQLLRDITNQESFPYSVIYPVPPS